MDKSDPRFLLLATIITAVVAIVFVFMVFSNIHSENINLSDKIDHSLENENFITNTPTIIPENKVFENKVLEQQTSNNKIIDIKITEFKTDKTNYISREEIKFSLKVLSQSDLKNAEIKIKGIKPYQYPYINESRIYDLKTGENIIETKASAPNCTSGCGGVYPGPYDIYVEIFINNKLITQSKTTINLSSN